jgi:hypothetical protein
MTTHDAFDFLTGSDDTTPVTQAEQASGARKPRTTRTLAHAPATMPNVADLADLADILAPGEFAIVTGMDVNGAPLANRMVPCRRYGKNGQTVKREISTTHARTGDDGNLIRAHDGKSVTTYTDAPGVAWSHGGDGQPATVWQTAILVFPMAGDGTFRTETVPMAKVGKGDATYGTGDATTLDLNGRLLSLDVTCRYRENGAHSVSARVYTGGKAQEHDAALLAAAARAAARSATQGDGTVSPADLATLAESLDTKATKLA